MSGLMATLDNADTTVDVNADKGLKLLSNWRCAKVVATSHVDRTCGKEITLPAVCLGVRRVTVDDEGPSLWITSTCTECNAYESVRVFATPIMVMAATARRTLDDPG